MKINNLSDKLTSPSTWNPNPKKKPNLFSFKKIKPTAVVMNVKTKLIGLINISIENFNSLKDEYGVEIFVFKKMKRKIPSFEKRKADSGSLILLM